MILLLLVVLTFASEFIDLSKEQCLCSQIKTRDDCLRYRCKVTSQQKADSRQRIDLKYNTYKNKTDIALIQDNMKCTALYCQDIKDEDICDNTGECAWNGKSCEVFTQCGNYVVNDSAKCILKSTDTKYCMPPDTVDSQQVDGKDAYTCKPDLSKAGGNFMTCFTFPTQDSCESYQDATCIWRIQSECDGEDKSVTSCLTYAYCLGIVIENCSDLNGRYDLCNRSASLKFCKWVSVNSTCADKECEDFTSQEKCQNILSDNKKKGKFCEWNSTNCIANFNSTQLGKENCLLDSMNISTWDRGRNQCVSCNSLEVMIIINLILFSLF